MSVYVVDYENVQAKGIAKIEKLSDKDIVIIFYSTNQPNIAIDVVKKIQKTYATVLFKEANVKIEETNKSFHDALDMQLATYMGYIIGKYQDKEKQHYIVSGDQGFSFVCEYWNNRGFRMARIKSIEESLAAPQDNEPVLPEYEKEVYKQLYKRKHFKFYHLTLAQKFEIYNLSRCGLYYVYEICEKCNVSSTTYKRVVREIATLIDKELKAK